ncbi:MAG TPA: DUF6531 domain-containing protein, partial [Bacillota bacterium]|nr:DUF6531 domain-containing protein [Bacillota bacterium]
MKRKITLILVVCFVILLFSSIVFSDTGGKNLVVLEMKAVEYTSCPYLYVFNGADYQFENDLISVGRTQSNEYTDQLMIGAQLPVSGGFIKLKVEEPPGENCRLDWLQLNAINHPEGTQAGVDEKGQAHTYAFPTAPQVALDQVNQNVTSRVAREDGQGVLLYDGQYITVNFVATDLSKGGKLILQATGFNRDEDLPETIIPKVPALEIQTLENGVWVTRGRFFPKVCAAYGVFDLQKYLDPAAPSIRIKSLSCRTNTAHLIDYLGLDNTPDNCSQEVLPLARALKNGATDVKDLVTASDGSYLEMQGGQDIVNLEFTPPVSTGVNDYFFTSKGFYQEADNTFYVYTKDSSGNFQNRWNSGWNGFQDSSPSNYKTLAIDLTPYVGQNFPDSKDQFIIKIQNRMNWQPQRFAAIDYVCLKIYDETIKDYRLLNLESAWDEATGLGLNLVELAQLKTDDGNPWNAFNRSLILTFGKDNHTNYYNAGFVDFYSYLSHLAGDPVNAATGNFVTQKDDIVVAGFNPISFRRVYNSIGNWQGVLGTNWRHSYEYQLIKTEGKVSITFSDGHMEEFTANPDGSYTPMPGKYGILKPNPAGGHILTQSDQTAYYFSSGGNLTAITDIHGNTTTIFYDNGKITKIQNDSGYLQLEYTGNLLTKVSDQLKRFTLYGYTDGKLTSFTAINGGAYQYSYDSQNRLIRIVDPLGNVKITNTYDSQNRIIGQTMADGSTNSFSYDDSSQITTCAERNGTKTLYKYDQKNRIYETDFPDGVQQVVINDQNQITAAVDKNGNRYSYEYDLKGNITRETNPLGDVTEYSYDNHNRLTSVREPDGGLYEYRYDSLGNLIASRDPLGREVKLEYNSKGLPVKVFMPDGSFSEAGYDARGNAVTVKDPLGNVTLNQYDDLNRLSGVIKPNGGQIRYEYTADGNLQKVT